MEKIKLVRENKEIGEIVLLCSFYFEKYDSSYLIYAKEGDLLPDNSNIVYFGKMLFKDDVDYLVSINDEEELSSVKAKIKELFKYSQDLESQKKEKNDISKIVKIPDNLFSTTYDVNQLNREKKNVDKYEKLEKEKVENNREYRSRLKLIYNNLNDLRPMDGVPDTLYVNYYNEMGMILRSKLTTLRQLWIEYQLLYNEKQKEYQEKIDDDELKKEVVIEEKVENSSLNNSKSGISSDFDELFESLSKRIDSLNDYLDELRELKEDIRERGNKDQIGSNDISIERKRLEQDKREFEEYKKLEKEKLSTKKEELQLHFNKFQTLVENFDKKIKDVK